MESVGNPIYKGVCIFLYRKDNQQDKQLYVSIYDLEYFFRKYYPEYKDNELEKYCNDNYISIYDLIDLLTQENLSTTMNTFLIWLNNLHHKY